HKALLAGFDPKLAIALLGIPITQTVRAVVEAHTLAPGVARRHLRECGRDYYARKGKKQEHCAQTDRMSHHNEAFIDFGTSKLRNAEDRGARWFGRLASQPPSSLLRMLPPLAQNTSTTPIREPPATTPEATGKVNSSARCGFRLSSTSAIVAPRKNKS